MSETPRFKVTSLTGYGGDGGNNAHLATSWQVLDSAYCYELVYESHDRKLIERGAAVLNGGDLTWPHGHLRRYWGGGGGQLRCMCSICHAKRSGYERERRALRKAAGA